MLYKWFKRLLMWWWVEDREFGVRTTLVFVHVDQYSSIVDQGKHRLHHGVCTIKGIMRPRKA